MMRSSVEGRVKTMRDSERTLAPRDQREKGKFQRMEYPSRCTVLLYLSNPKRSFQQFTAIGALRLLKEKF